MKFGRSFGLINLLVCLFIVFLFYFNRFVMDVGLFKKCYCVVEILSGGMKRKLFVVMVFVVGLRIIILDEFIVGVDFYVRRVIWDFLIKYKRGK